MGKKSRMKMERRRIQQSDVRLQAYGTIIHQLTAFRDEIAEPDSISTIYYPCCGKDISVDLAFPDAVVLHVDQDSEVIQTLQRQGRVAICGNVLSHQLMLEYDMLYLFNPQISDTSLASVVKDGGWVVCNNFHGNASAFRQHRRYEIVAVVDPIPNETVKPLVHHQPIPESCWRVFTDDSEFQRQQPGIYGTIQAEMKRLSKDLTEIDALSPLAYYELTRGHKRPADGYALYVFRKRGATD